MHLIAGIDPGTTTGIAVLDFKGRLIDLSSSKDLGLRRAIKYLMSKGNVSLIASDVSPCPEFVSKIATKLGASTYAPPQSLLIHDKISLTKSYQIEDSHQRDALAAALAAFHSFQQNFHKIDALDEKEEKKEKIKHLLLHGFSISKAQLKLEKEEKEEKPEKKKKRKRKSEQEKKKEKREEKRKEEISELKKDLLQKEKEIKNLQRDIKIIKKRYRVELKKEEEIQKREKSISSLQNKIRELEFKLRKVDQLKEIWEKIARKEVIPLVLFPQKGKVVLIKRKLRKRDLPQLKGIKIALTSWQKNKKYLKERGILVANPKKVKNLFGLFYLNSKDLREVKKVKKALSLEKIIEDYRERE